MHEIQHYIDKNEADKIIDFFNNNSYCALSEQEISNIAQRQRYNVPGYVPVELYNSKKFIAGDKVFNFDKKFVYPSITVKVL